MASSVLVTKFNKITANGDGDNQWDSVKWFDAIDGATATVHLKDGFTSESVTTKDSDYVSPGAGYVITGFEVRFNASNPNLLAVASMNVYLANNDVAIGSKQDIAIDSDSATLYTLGSSTDLWGQTTWTGPDEIDPGSFGLYFFITVSGDTTDPVLDGFEVEVFYEAAAADQDKLISFRTTQRPFTFEALRSFAFKARQRGFAFNAVDRSKSFAAMLRQFVFKANK